MLSFFKPNIQEQKAKGDIRGLINVLSHKNESVRQSAVEALGELRESQAVEPLISVLRNDKDENVRMVAAKSLGQIGDARAIEPLIDMLFGSNKSISSIAAESLKKMGCTDTDRRIIDRLICMLDNREKKEAAITELEKIGAPALDALFAAYRESGGSYRGYDLWVAIEKIIQNIGTSSISINFLTEQLRNGELFSREQSAKVLDALGWQPSKDEYGMAYWFAKDNLQKCIEIGLLGVEPLLSDLDGKKAWRSGSSVGNLHNKLWLHRSKIIKILDAIGWQPSQDENSITYWIAKREWEKCIEIGTPAIDPLISELSMADSKTAPKITETLVKIGDVRAVEPLIALFQKKLNFREPTNEDELASSADVEKDRLCKFIAEALGKFGDDRAIAPLEKAALMHRWFNRHSAVAAIREIKAKNSQIPPSP